MQLRTIQTIKLNDAPWGTVLVIGVSPSQPAVAGWEAFAAYYKPDLDLLKVGRTSVLGGKAVIFVNEEHPTYQADSTHVIMHESAHVSGWLSGSPNWRKEEQVEMLAFFWHQICHQWPQ